MARQGLQLFFPLLDLLVQPLEFLQHTLAEAAGEPDMHRQTIELQEGPHAQQPNCSGLLPGNFFWPQQDMMALNMINGVQESTIKIPLFFTLIYVSAE